LPSEYGQGQFYSLLFAHHRVSNCLNVKVKFTLEHATKAQRGSRGVAVLLTSALDGVGGQCHAPAALTPGKTRYPLYRRLGGPQPVWTGPENLVICSDGDIRVSYVHMASCPPDEIKK